MGKSTSQTSPPASESKPKETSTSTSEEPKESKSETLLESSYEVKVTLADQQADPNSPLYSAKSFDQLGLHPDLLKGIYSMKYQKPSKIQERALPLLLQNPWVANESGSRWEEERGRSWEIRKEGADPYFWETTVTSCYLLFDQDKFFDQ